jgi:hypothetical protein
MATYWATCEAWSQRETTELKLTALPDGGFLCQIWTILADLKVIWRAKNISDGLPIYGGFLADFDQFCMGLFLSDGSGGFWRFWNLY